MTGPDYARPFHPRLCQFGFGAAFCPRSGIAESDHPLSHALTSRAAYSAISFGLNSYFGEFWGQLKRSNRLSFIINCLVATFGSCLA